MEMLAEALPRIKDGGYPFVIHVGDYKGGGQECTGFHDARFQTLMDTLQPLPVFYTPGDNEWTDCDRFKHPQTGEPYSDLKRLDRVRELFFADPPTSAMGYKRQAGFPENASWTYAGVRFLTLHVTGTNNGRDWVTGDPLEDALAAVTARDAANLAWLAEGFTAAKTEGARAVVLAMQADMTDIGSKPEDLMCADVAANSDHPCDAFADLRAAIRDAAKGFAGPVLLIHGDTAPFTLGQSFAGEEAPSLWRLNAAGDSGVGRTGIPYGVRDVTVVTLTPGAHPPFAAIGLVSGKAPKAGR